MKNFARVVGLLFGSPGHIPTQNLGKLPSPPGPFIDPIFHALDFQIGDSTKWINYPRYRPRVARQLDSLWLSQI